LKLNCDKNKEKINSYVTLEDETQCWPVAIGGAPRVTPAGKVTFQLTLMARVIGDFSFQGRQSTDTKTVQFGPIMFSPLRLQPPPIGIMKDLEVQFIGDK
jgi:hypothetical protein